MSINLSTAEKTAKEEGLRESTAIAFTDTMGSLAKMKKFLKENDSEEDSNDRNDNDDNTEMEMSVLLDSESILKKVLEDTDFEKEFAQFLLDDDDYDEDPNNTYYSFISYPHG